MWISRSLTGAAACSQPPEGMPWVQASPAHELREVALSLGSELHRASTGADLASALGAARDEAEARGAAATVVCGSLYLVGQYLSMQ